MPIKTTPTDFITAAEADAFGESLSSITLRASAPPMRAAIDPATPGRPAPRTVRMTGMTRQA